MKTKKMLCAVIMLICCTFLMGCVNIEYQRLVDDYGRILDKVTVELDYDSLSKKGYSDYEIKNLLDIVRLDVKKNFADVLDSNLRFINELDPILYNEIRPKITLGEAVIKVADEANKIYKVSYEVLFDNSQNYSASEIMRIAYGGSVSEEGGAENDTPLETVEGDFLTKYVQKTENQFGDVTTTTYGGVNLYEKYKDICPEFTDEDIKLTQIYGSTDYRLKSNADLVRMVEGYNCHLWELNVIEAKEFDLEFYYLSPTTSDWYVLALGLSVAVVAVLLVVYFVKKYNKKSHTEVVYTNEEEGGQEDGK